MFSNQLLRKLFTNHLNEGKVTDNTTNKLIHWIEFSFWSELISTLDKLIFYLSQMGNKWLFKTFLQIITSKDLNCPFKKLLCQALKFCRKA